MRSLVRALRAEHRSVRVPWDSLADIIRPGPGNLVLVIADPGVGKSAFAVAWALQAQEPTLLFSWDTDLFTQATRVVAHMTGTPTYELADRKEEAADYLQQQDLRTRFVDITMSLEDMKEVIRAEKEFWPLQVVVVDMLAYAVPEQNSPSYDETLLQLHRVAREQDVCILILHHLNRNKDKPSGTEAPTMDRSRYAGDRDCEIVLGLWSPHGNDLNISIVKNRTGHGDPTGAYYVSLTRDIGRMKLEEPMPTEQGELL